MMFLLETFSTTIILMGIVLVAFLILRLCGITDLDRFLFSKTRNDFDGRAHLLNVRPGIKQKIIDIRVVDNELKVYEGSKLLLSEKLENHSKDHVSKIMKRFSNANKIQFRVHTP
jgi:hypothetical protein